MDDTSKKNYWGCWRPFFRGFPLAVHKIEYVAAFKQTFGMYKVSHASLPRPTALVYNGHRVFSARCDFHEKRAFNQYLIEDIPCKYQMQLPLPVFSKKIQRHPIAEVKTKVDTEAVSCLDNSWHNFSYTSDGLPDTTIVHFRPKKGTPKDFVAFDVEKYLTERLLKAVDLDPKIVNGF